MFEPKIVPYWDLVLLNSLYLLYLFHVMETDIQFISLSHEVFFTIPLKQLDVSIFSWDLLINKLLELMHDWCQFRQDWISLSDDLRENLDLLLHIIYLRAFALYDIEWFLFAFTLAGFVLILQVQGKWIDFLERLLTQTWCWWIVSSVEFHISNVSLFAAFALCTLHVKCFTDLDSSNRTSRWSFAVIWLSLRKSIIKCAWMESVSFNTYTWRSALITLAFAAFIKDLC